MSSRIAPLPTPKPNPPKSAATRKARPSAMTTALASVMTKAGALECSQDAQVLFPGEYSFVKRFRLRRLLAFLWRQGCLSTFIALLKQTRVFFCVDYLAQFVAKGQWTGALDYLVPRFLPPVPQQSTEGRLLVLFLSQHRAFHLDVTRRQLRVDMRPVWAKAAGIVRDLATRAPELKDRLLLPAAPMRSQNVLPIGFGFAPFHRRWHVKKHTRPKSSAIAKLYLHKRSSLPSSSHSNQELSPAELRAKALEWFRRIKRESVEPLVRLPKLNQGCALQSSVRKGTPFTGNVINPECSSVASTIDEGAPVAPVCHAMFGDGINLAKNSTISLMAKTGQEVCYTGSACQGSYLRKRPMTEHQEDYLDIKKQRTAGANDEASTPTPTLHIVEQDAGAAGHPKPNTTSINCIGAPDAPVCHAMFGVGINSAENSVIPLMAKTGGAAISQTMLGTMACPAENSEVISATNDGTGQEVCYTGSACQGSYPRKRPMAEQQEDYLDLKKQRTAGANGGEASTPTPHVTEGEKTLEQLDIRLTHLQTKISELLPVAK
ncbi:unnamed protein product [Alopecurus aequalis]